MIKKLLLGLLASCLCLCGVACSDCSSQKEPEQEKPVITGENMLNGFNSIEDLYKINWINYGYSTTGKMDINRDADYIKEGDGSLKFDITSALMPEIRIQPENTPFPDMDLTDLKTLSVWIYNANDDVVTATLNVMKTNMGHLLSKSFELPAKEWTHCVMDVNAVVTKYAYENITGFSIQFMTEDASRFFIDDFSAEFGRVFTEEDNGYIEKIESLIEEIKGLPDGAKASDETAITAAYNKYSELPDLYKMAVSNYSTLSGSMKNLLYAMINDSSSASEKDGLYERPAFLFDKFYGTTHMAIAESTDCSFGYTKDVKYGDEDGSSYIAFNGDMWNYVDISTSLNLSEYDYVTFYMYNEGGRKAFWFNNKTLGWNSRHNLEADKWTEISVPVSCLNASGVQLIYTNLNSEGNCSSTDGKVYFSQLRCYKMNQTSLYKTALYTENPFTATNASLTSESGITTVTTSVEGEVKLGLNKTLNKASVGQEVLFSFYIDKLTNISLLNEEGVKTTQKAVAEGWNTIALSASEYNALSKISVDAEAGEKFRIGMFYSISEKDKQAMLLVLEKNYLPAVSACTIDDIPQMIEYVSVYNEASLNNLRDQFVKVKKSDNDATYTEQENFYLSIVQGIYDYADKTGSLMQELVNSINVDSEADEEKASLLINVYNDYNDSRFLKPLEGVYASKAQSIIDKFNYLPYKFIDVSVSKDRGNFAIQSGDFPWSGKIISANDAEYGKVMAIYVKELQKRKLSSGHETVYESHDHIELKYSVSFDLSNYDYVGFKIYNPGSAKSVYFVTEGWGETVATFKLEANSWNEICISCSDFNRAGYMHIVGVSTKDSPVTFLFHDFNAYDEKYVQKRIGDLPEASTITLSDEATVKAIREDYNKLSNAFKRKVSNVATLEACETAIVKLLIDALPDKDSLTVFDYEQISSVKAAYEALSADNKNKVTNYSALLTIETAYKESYTVIADMATKDGFTHDYDMGGYEKVSLGVGYDSVYKNYLKITVHTAFKGDSDPHLLIKHSLTTDMYATCEKVIFYIYNGSSIDRKVIAKYDGSWNTEFKSISLKAKDWTKVELTVEEFSKITEFGVAYPSSEICEYKISMIYGETAKSAAKNVMAMINELPDANALTAFDGTIISAVQNAYNALSTAAKAQVTNYSVLQATVSAYNAKYAVLADMSSTSGFTHNYDMGGYEKVSLSVGYDSVYKNYLKINVHTPFTASESHLVIKHSITADKYAACEKIVFYIYNGSSTDRNIIAKYNGSWNTELKSISLKAKDWTKVELTVEEFSKITEFGIAYLKSEVCEYRISMIYGETASEAAAKVTAMINALPNASTVVALDGSKISAAKTAYNALSETAKAQVTNYATLTALETAYNNKYKVVLDMTSTSGFSINTNYTSSGVTLSVGTDETYGSYLCAKASNQVGEHLTMNYPKASDLSTMLEGYDKVCFYVYCDKLTGDSALFSNFGGAGYKFGYNGQTLEAGKWVKFEISKDDFVSGSWFGIGYNPKAASEYKFSMFWAE